MPAQKYILKGSDDKDLDDKMEGMKKAAQEKDKEIDELKAKLQATNDKPVVPGDDPRGLHSMFKAILTAMDDEDHEMKKGMKKGMDEEHMENAKKAIKAIMEVFEEGNGEQVNNKTQVGSTLGEPSTKVTPQTAALLARISELEAKESNDYSNKILTAKTLKGATEEDIKSESNRLGKMSLKAIKEEYNASKIFIEDALNANSQEYGVEALIAKEETNFEFNGMARTGLMGNTVSIDKALGVVQQ